MKNKTSMTKLPKKIRSDITEHIKIVAESRREIAKGNYLTWEEFMKEAKEINKMRGENKCNHRFWRDRNPPNCFNCGKTELELWQELLKKKEQKAFKEGYNKGIKQVVIKALDQAIESLEKENKPYLAHTS